MTKPTQGSRHPGIGETVAGRYQLLALLGQGGLASVYRAHDPSTGRDVALKQLTAGDASTHVRALFEREFATLTQLQHPHVIAVYDYGVEPSGLPYYTMELLDGDDLRDCAPLPWRDVCRLLFDVCSSLALLHSRHLLHRDITPRNIRRTQTGHAKLIDFGAMAPMTSGAADIVGTPAFTAPESLHRLALDGRTDLFSFGATMYFALTREPPFRARSFAEMIELSARKPTPPSRFAPDIPRRLDDLVLALLNPEPTLRPHSAAEVMQRLAALGDLNVGEVDAVSRAYLSTPSLVGRDAALQSVRQKLRAARSTRSAGVLFAGPPRMGRSRLLDACALEAKTLGYLVLRATASGTPARFAVVKTLLEHWATALPPNTLQISVGATPLDDAKASDAKELLRLIDDESVDSEAVQRAVCHGVLQLSQRHALFIAIDDVHRIDETSAATIAALLDAPRRHNILVALTHDRDSPSDVVSVLARRCEVTELAPLSHADTHSLLSSLFGDPAHLDNLAREVHQLSRGNPGDSVDVAQYWVDRGLIRYVAGQWTLPVRIGADAMPRDRSAPLRARIAGLSPDARFLLESQALAFRETFSDADYRALLPDASSHAIELAIGELLASQAVVSDGAVYTLANRSWTQALSMLEPRVASERHRALANMYHGRSRIAEIHHWFAGGFHAQGLERMREHHIQLGGQFDQRKLLEENIGKLMWCADLAIATALELSWKPREVHDLRRWLLAGTLTYEDGAYTDSARIWFEQLARDSGLELYRADTQSSNPGERLMRALTRAQERYHTTPEGERVYSVEEAIRLLPEYVAYSIALGARANDHRLLETLPAVLEPFVPLSPAIAVIHRNAIATCMASVDCQFEQARACWIEVLQQLDAMTPEQMQHVEAIRNAVAFALGVLDAQMGISSASDWASRLDNDPYQRVSAKHLRRIARLEQGDFRGAERLRREAEVLALQTRSPQLFRALIGVEIVACTQATDLAGIFQGIERTKELAAVFPGWVPYLRCSEAAFDLVRGDYESAIKAFEAVIETTGPDADGRMRCTPMWVSAQSGLAESLFQANRVKEAQAVASSALEACERRNIGAHSFDLIRTLAVVEAKLGVQGAVERLERLEERQRALGVTGLRLGLTYEARARMAIWAGDAAAFEHYARATAKEYRYADRSSLGARYERLLNEAGRNGLQTAVRPADFAVTSSAYSEVIASDEERTVLERKPSEAQLDDRARVALEQICKANGVAAGHLYLLDEGVPVLAASRGAHAPDAALGTQVRDHLATVALHTQELEEMLTGEAEDGDDAFKTVEVAGTEYMLLTLRCVVDQVGTVAGVVALTGGAAQDCRAHTHLLQTLAASLLKQG
jgi:Protein kinase domain/AAA ATPase domain